MDERGHVLLALLAIGVTLIFAWLIYWSVSAMVRALATGRIRTTKDEWDNDVWCYRDSGPVSFWANLAIKLAAAVLSASIFAGFIIPLWVGALK
ncbi:hypothetical protein ACQR1W_39005 [Bradyrhizobium sp. HKCCYLS1011]|uniref:hypothetical protein n=1 Tax=Bradyrhizobium sp. HKCCYLS1011 TaxID=3420733 RepID=UPI003EBE8BD1